MKSLTPAEQNDLAVRAKAGDRKATADLLAFCERDVVAIVAKWRVSEAEREDLQQVGRMTILEHAIRTFSPTKGYQFRFWAAQWVRTEVKRSMCKNSSVVVRNLRTITADIAFDAPVDEDGADLRDSIPDPAANPEEVAAFDNGMERVREAMEAIIQRLRHDANLKYDRIALCRDIVYNRLLSDTPTKLDVLADRYGVVRETVRKLEVSLLKRVRSTLVEA